MPIFDVLTWDLVLITFRLAIPITFAAVGGTLSERSGVINIGLEGMMLMGAFGGVLGSFLTGSAWMGLVFAMILGGLAGLVHAVLSVHYKANQVVSGVGINILASGLTVILVRAIWGKEGMSAQVASLDMITVPLLNKIPYLGDLFTDQTPLLYLMIIVVATAWFVMFKTNIGLRLRALGDHPQAVRTAGISIKKYRFICVILSGVLSGLGGSYLSIVHNNIFVQGMTAGRGFMALAANIFGGWNPAGSFGAGLIFAFAQAIRLNMLEFEIPDQFIQMLPYIVTLLILVLAGRKSRAPESLGAPDE